MKIIKIAAFVIVCIMALGIVRCNISANSTVKAIEKYYEEIALVSETVMGTEDEEKILKAVKRFGKASEKYYSQIESFMDMAEGDNGMISERVMKRAAGTLEKIDRAERELIPEVERKVRKLAESNPKIRNYIESN